MFNEWLMKRVIRECNLLLNEIGIETLPQLSIKADLNNLPGKLLKHYKKEIGIQSRYGGIRNPAVVLVNKIRHEFTNYDQVRDELTYLKNNGSIDDCVYFDTLSKIIEKVGVLVLVLIDKIKCPFDINVCSVSKDKMHDANDFYIRKEISLLSSMRKSNNC